MKDFCSERDTMIWVSIYMINWEQSSDYIFLNNRVLELKTIKEFLQISNNKRYRKPKSWTKECK